MKREQIIKAIIDSLGLLEDTKGHGYKLHIYKGKWWISHNVVGSGEPVRQWLEREIEKLYQQTYLNECIAKAEPNLSKIKDVDGDLAEIIEEEKCSRCKDISDELVNWIKCVRE